MVSRKLMEKLFCGGGSRSMTAFPLRMVYIPVEQTGGVQAQVLVSVSKRHFKRAVKRNRAKRQIREAYRLNKHLLAERLGGEGGRAVAIAFIWLADEPQPSDHVHRSMVSLLRRLAEKI